MKAGRRGVVCVLVAMCVTTPVARANDKNGQDNTPLQCSQAVVSIARNGTLPNLRLFRKGHGALRNNTLTLFDDHSKYSSELKAAAESWTNATHGAINVRVVNTATKGSVRVYDVDRDTHWVGWTRRDPWRILLNDNFLSSMDFGARQATLAHEIGHTMGLKHGCPGTVMHAISDTDQNSTPTQMDVVALLQKEESK